MGYSLQREVDKKIREKKGGPPREKECDNVEELFQAVNVCVLLTLQHE